MVAVSSTSVMPPWVRLAATPEVDSGAPSNQHNRSSVWMVWLMSTPPPHGAPPGAPWGGGVVRGLAVPPHGGTRGEDRPVRSVVDQPAQRLAGVVVAAVSYTHL